MNSWEVICYDDTGRFLATKTIHADSEADAAELARQFAESKGAEEFTVIPMST